MKLKQLEIELEGYELKILAASVETDGFSDYNKFDILFRFCNEENIYLETTVKVKAGMNIKNAMIRKMKTIHLNGAY